MDSTLLRSGTVNSLFTELNSLRLVEKKGYIEDWLIHFAPSNPVYEATQDPNTIKITFFIKEKPDSRWNNLFLVGDSWGWDIPKYRFEKIKNTNWWFLSFKRPRGARLHYLLSPNDLGTKIKSYDRKERRKKWFFDTRNKLSVDGIRRIHSVATFPGFEDPLKYSKYELNLKPMRIPKKLQGSRSAKYAILTKKGDTEDPEHLLYIHDEASALQYMELGSILQSGINQDRWPSMVIIPLSIGDDERTQEYGGRDGYPEFFANFIIPTCQEILNLTFEPKNITLYGNSLGAWGAFDVVWNRPDAIKNVICQSSPWWWAEANDSIEPEFYISEILESAKQKIDKIYIDCGIYETAKKPISTYESNKKFVAALNKKKYNHMGREVLMGHRYQSWAWSIPSALDFIYNGVKEFGPLPGRKMRK
ncbi:MAG: hypothetical protein IH840_03155 [Candidatus Heimdallarchaeota archaeon]|nr:hypothetical protein [Candidatus Heimdallarchaeota archaeon]